MQIVSQTHMFRKSQAVDTLNGTYLNDIMVVWCDSSPTDLHMIATTPVCFPPMAHFRCQILDH